MIKLITEYYCHDCPFFDSEIERIYSEDEHHTTLIRCIHEERCKKFYKRIAEIEAAASINPDSCEWLNKTKNFDKIIPIGA